MTKLKRDYIAMTVITMLITIIFFVAATLFAIIEKI